jgi:hypothetical protein
MIKISEARWGRLLRDLFHRQDVETAGLVFAQQINTPGGLVLAVRDAFVVPDDAYSIRRIDQLQLNPVALNRLMRPAKDRGLSIFTIHTHPGASEAWFSRADDAGDDRLLPSFRNQMPDNVHGSMVVVENGMSLARGLIAGDRVSLPVRVVGRTLSTISQRARDAKHPPWFGRQVLALGGPGQAALRVLRVGVVGLGGTGSIVTAQLAHHGVGGLVLVDGDTIEETNVPRILGAAMRDVGRLKVDVARRYIDDIGFGTEVQTIAEALTIANLKALSDCDVVFSCVDRQTPRAILNRFAYSLMTPVIDMGVAFRVDDAGAITGDAGRVVVIGPDRPCLGCWGHLDPDALRTEALSEQERRDLAHEGYIAGADEPQPSVMAFNTMVAGAAVVEMLRLVTGFAGAEDPPARLAFSFSQGTVRRNSLAGEGACMICGGVRR